MLSQGKTRVAHYWAQGENQHKWGNWIPKEGWNGFLDQETLLRFLDLENRKTLVSVEEDRIQWGWSTKGSFTVREAYMLAIDSQNLPKLKIWRRIWGQNLRPKVSNFLWLMVQIRTLTWDNLCKRGFVEPSRCSLCLYQEETIEHLFKSCPFVGYLWDQSEILFRRRGRISHGILASIEESGHKLLLTTL